MTIEQIKEQLPNIRVKTKTGIKLWWLSGGKDGFASLCDPNDVSHRVDVAWETICHVVNTHGSFVRL